MKIIKNLLFINTFIVLFALSSCSRKTTKEKTTKENSSTIITSATQKDIFFCANALYNSKEDIPRYIFSYYCYDETYSGDVELKMGFGQSYALMFDDFETYEYLNSDSLFDEKNNDYKIYVVDENNNKKELRIAIRPNPKLIFLNTKGKNMLYCWALRDTQKISIPKEYFDKNEGSVFLSAFEENKTTDEEKSLVSITIKYTKDENGIRLIPPENSIFDLEYSGRNGGRK